MTHRWESSGRPLFVKTVYVNGSRHAILSQEDPLLQSGNSSLRKQFRPDSSLSFTSAFSTHSSGSQNSVSEIRIKSSKSPIRRQHSKNLSSELQECLVKLQFGSSIQENKKPEADKEKLNTLQDHKECEELSDEISDKQIGKKWNHCKVSNECQRDQQNYNEESMKENVISECKCKSRSDCDLATDSDHCKEKKNYCFMKFSSKKSQFILDCNCEKNWCDIHNFVSCNDPINSKKANGILNETFHNLVFCNKVNEKRSNGKTDDYFYAFSNLSSRELYWNNYLARSFNNSLSERVIQWMDLKRKQKKHEQKFHLSIEEVSLDSPERIFSGKTYIDKMSAIKSPVEQEPEKSVQTKKESDTRKIASTRYRDDEINKSSPAEKKDSKKSDCRNEVKVDNKNLLVEKKEMESTSKNQLSQNHCDESTMISISPKIDPNLWEANDLENSIASYLQIPVQGTTESVVNATEFKSVFPAKSVIPKKTVSDSYNCSLQHPTKLLSHWESNKDEEKDFNIKAMKVLEKKNFLGKIKKSEAVEKIDRCTEYAKTAVKSETNENRIGKTNVPQENLIFQRHNDVFCLSESRSTCPIEKNLARQQLHIFIPSLLSKDKIEESTSECESFLNET